MGHIIGGSIDKAWPWATYGRGKVWPLSPLFQWIQMKTLHFVFLVGSLHCWLLTLIRPDTCSGYLIGNLHPVASKLLELKLKNLIYYKAIRLNGHWFYLEGPLGLAIYCRGLHFIYMHLLSCLLVVNIGRPLNTFSLLSSSLTKIFYF